MVSVDTLNQLINYTILHTKYTRFTYQIYINIPPQTQDGAVNTNLSLETSS